MTSINDLPPEILIRIAVLGANLPDHLADESKRRSFLRSFALVCHQWQHPAQLTLWKSIWIGRFSQEELELFCESAATEAGELVTLDVNLFADFTAQEVDRLLEHCKSVRRLNVSGGLLAPRVLKSEALLGLKTLCLDGLDYTPLDATRPFTLDFVLDHLDIEIYPSLSPTLLEPLLQPSLTSAIFHINDDTLENNSEIKTINTRLIELLSGRSLNLRKLEVYYFFPEPPVQEYSFLKSILETRPFITHLTIEYEFLHYLDTFAGRLSTLGLQYFDANWDWGPIINLVGKKGPRCLVNLKCLSVKGSLGMKGQEGGGGTWDMLEMACRERKIELLVRK